MRLFEKEMWKKRVCGILAGTMAFLLVLGLVLSPFMSVSAASALPTLSCTKADEWTALFDRKGQEKTWLGADGIYSVALNGDDGFGSATDDTKTFFIFSDSLMGTADENGNVTWAPGQPSQTSAVLTGNEPDSDNMQFVWGTGGNYQFGWDQHLFGEHKWMLDCMVVGDAVYVFGFPEQEWKPKQIDMIKIPIENGEPNYSKYEKTAAIPELWYRDGDTALYAYGVGVMCNTEAAGAVNPDGYIYLYGYRDALNDWSRKDLIVSRVKESDFPDFSHTEYWDGERWSNNIQDSAVLLKSVSCEFSVTPITSGPYTGKYIAVYTENTESASMRYAIGDSPVGPFDDPVTFYTAPEHGGDNGGMYTYNAKAHPHLSKDGKLLVSYNCNNRNTFGNQKTYEYHPRFLWLSLDPLNGRPYTLTSSVFDIWEDVIRVTAGTDTAALLDGLNEKEYVVFSGNGTVKTGMNVTLSDYIGYGVAVIGDVSGDGAVTATDLTKQAGHISRISTLTSVFFLSAADMDGDGLAGATDLTALARQVGNIG